VHASGLLHIYDEISLSGEESLFIYVGGAAELLGLRVVDVSEELQHGLGIEGRLLNLDTVDSEAGGARNTLVGRVFPVVPGAHL
jgi:hypothetical protein